MIFWYGVLWVVVKKIPMVDGVIRIVWAFSTNQGSFSSVQRGRHFWRLLQQAWGIVLHALRPALCSIVSIALHQSRTSGLLLVLSLCFFFSLISGRRVCTIRGSINQSAGGKKVRYEYWSVHSGAFIGILELGRNGYFGWMVRFGTGQVVSFSRCVSENPTSFLFWVCTGLSSLFDMSSWAHDLACTLKGNGAPW